MRENTLIVQKTDNGGVPPPGSRGRSFHRLEPVRMAPDAPSGQKSQGLEALP